MAFKVICEKCGAEGRIFQKKDSGVFSWSLRGEGNIGISHDEDDDDQGIIITCMSCGHEINDL